MRLVAAAACSLALTAHAVEPAQLAREIGVDPSKEVAQTRVFEDVVVAPIPISNPTVGTGLAVVVMPFYHLGDASPLSNTAVALGYTSSGSWAIGAAQSTRLRGDDLRIDGFLAYINLRYPFYGIGASAGEKGLGVPIQQKAFAFAPELLFKVAPGVFLGARYRGVRVDTALDTADVTPGLAPIVDVSSSITTSGIGPVAVLDTRDNEMSPASGWLADFRANFAEHNFGSDGSYRTFSASVNHYGRLGPGVLALRGYACGATDQAPLFDLCLFGGGNDLRGYEIGRYRDRAMFAAQTEYRFPLSGRFGAVAFAGVGKVASSFDEMGSEPALPSIGAGLRWLASAKARVNLSIDVAKGRDDTSLYVYVKEAF